PLLGSFVNGLAALKQKIKDMTTSLRFFDLADLVNNQPQILVSADYRKRNVLVGPNELDAKATYEIGFANVNGLRRYCANAKLAPSNPDCLSRYLADFGPLLASSPRLAVSAEYSRADPYRFDLQADYEDFSGDPKLQDRLVATATFTQKMSDNSTASFSFIYASKPEFLGEVDKHLSAHLGLKYKMDKRKDSPAN
ncbi:MAG TPA: hypothetical protein VFC23_12250, partial [Thermoanaerobaculia bacterium]|nr:hypothetical protein [Thermoanaerobaculia bacterium]